MSELIDVFNCFAEKIGVEDRKKVHQTGQWHQTFHCWLTKKVDGKIYVLFQQRSAIKDDSPNTLDITAAGHLLSGETKEDGIRELNEELGIEIDYDKLKYLGIHYEIIDVPGFKNSEFQHVYLLEDNRELKDYKLQEEEVAGLIEVEFNDGVDLFLNKKKEIYCKSAFIENNKIIEKIITVKKEYFIPRLDNYYIKVFIAAERYFEGKDLLSI